jgi:hypothetical protein
MTEIPNLKINRNSFDILGAVRGFKMKLKLIWKQRENYGICHFIYCDLLHKDGPVSVTFPNVCAADIIDFFAENFKMRSSNFCSHATNV